MSRLSDFVDWNELMEDDDVNVNSEMVEGAHKQVGWLECENGVQIVEQPPSSPDSQDTVMKNRCNEDDVLDLYCSEAELPLSDVCGEIDTTARDVPSREQRTKKRMNNGFRKIYKRPSQSNRKQRCVEPQLQKPKRSQPPRKPQERRLFDHNYNGSWVVRSVRNGYENLVYDICNCNETPNVVFVGLCHQRSDVYKMVLRNCDGKRRYWYDKSTRRTHLPAGANISDFERAIRWRAATVGRTSSSPGYDLAAFVLQNVATDKRCRVSSLVLVTTDDMLSASSTNQQLLFRERKSFSMSVSGRRTFRDLCRKQQHYRCSVCRSEASIVTNDSAGISTFTCWQHAATYMAEAGLDSTRVCNTVVVDIQFLLQNDGSLVSRLRLVDGESGNTAENRSLTVAELVFLPFGTQISEITKQSVEEQQEKSSNLQLETAHAYNCGDRHYNEEDMFASMPVSRGGCGVQQYDTTIGRVVDRLHCMTSTFQKCLIE